MMIFSGSSNKPLAEAIAKTLDISVSDTEIHVFPDGEKRIKVDETVVGQDAIVIQSTAPPVDSHCMELFFLIDALRRTGAKTVTAVIPYFGYERQDHTFRLGEARSLEVVIRTLEMLKVDRVISFDFHSIKIPEMFQIPVTHLSALSVFAEKIKEEGWTHYESFLVSPDMGGIRRIEQLSHMLDLPYVTVEKNRDIVSGSIEVSKFHGNLRKRAIMIDDIIASGKTIDAACNLLFNNGVEEAYVFATHPVFSPEAPEILQNSKATNVFVTDSIHLPENKKFEKLEILSIAPQIASELT